MYLCNFICSLHAWTVFLQQIGCDSTFLLQAARYFDPLTTEDLQKCKISKLACPGLLNPDLELCYNGLVDFRLISGDLGDPSAHSPALSKLLHLCQQPSSKIGILAGVSGVGKVRLKWRTQRRYIYNFEHHIEQSKAFIDLARVHYCLYFDWGKANHINNNRFKQNIQHLHTYLPSASTLDLCR